MRKKELSKQQCADIFSEVLEGLVHIHSFNIMHGDLGKRNVFFYKGQPKIGDSGLSRNIGDADDQIVSDGGLPDYVPSDKRVSTKVDVYSLGILLVEMFLNIRTHVEAQKVLHDLKKDEPVFPKDFPDALKSWVTKMLKTDPEDRPSSKEILDSLKKIRNAIKAMD